jgi:hypothetical protein
LSFIAIFAKERAEKFVGSRVGRDYLRSLNFGTSSLESWSAINLVAADATFLTQPV